MSHREITKHNKTCPGTAQKKQKNYKFTFITNLLCELFKLIKYNFMRSILYLDVTNSISSLNNGSSRVIRTNDDVLSLLELSSHYAVIGETILKVVLEFSDNIEPKDRSTKSNFF